MKALVVSFGEELRACGELIRWAAPRGASDLLVLGSSRPDRVPTGAKQVYWMPGPAEEECVDLWLSYAGTADCARDRYDLILLPDSAMADILAPSLAWALGYSCLTGAHDLTAQDGRLQAVQGVCCMELEAIRTVCLPAVVSLSVKGAEDGPEASEPREAEQLPGPAGPADRLAAHMKFQPAEAETALASAAAVLVAGRGIGGGAGMEKLTRLARRLGAAAAATRPVVFEGLAPLNQLIGASAAIISPERCVVFGASGSAAFMIGVDGSRMLAGVNTDPGAPLFEHCDYGVEADCGALLDALLMITEEQNTP